MRIGKMIDEKNECHTIDCGKCHHCIINETEFRILKILLYFITQNVLSRWQYKRIKQKIRNEKSFDKEELKQRIKRKIQRGEIDHIGVMKLKQKIKEVKS